MSKPVIVVSAVNITRGGTLQILQQCLEYLSTRTEQYQVFAIVHSKELAIHQGIEYIEIPSAKKSWLARLWCEKVTMNGLSRKLPPVSLWLSLHDTTPRVQATKKAVYCHNSFSFYKAKPRDLCLNYKVFLFSWLTKNFIYRPNIHANDYIIVQTHWFKKAFQELFSLPQQKIIVFPPMVPNTAEQTISHTPQSQDSDHITTFYYPATADIHKNFEVLCKASQLLEKQLGKGKFKTILTLKGDENSYARYLYKRWGTVASISFVGYQSKYEMNERYRVADALVFPSKVETWGLPITEFGKYQRPTLLADLPYAHETAGGLQVTAYFSPDDPCELATLMHQVIRGDLQSFQPTAPTPPTPPEAQSWDQLFTQLLP